MILYDTRDPKSNLHYLLGTLNDDAIQTFLKDNAIELPRRIPKHLSHQVGTNVRENYTLIRFVYCHILEEQEQYQGHYEMITVIYTAQDVVTIFEENSKLVADDDHLFLHFDYASRGELIYHIMDACFIRMAETLYSFEDTIREIESDVMSHDKETNIHDIIEIRNIAYKIKRYLHLSLYIGDDLLLNENKLLEKSSMQLIRGLDNRMNRCSEYANTLFESSNHLRETYDSAVNEQTNTLINKLTVITVIATPATVLTGIYGMNFKYMPGLDHPWGYPALILSLLGISTLIYIILKKSKVL